MSNDYFDTGVLGKVGTCRRSIIILDSRNAQLRQKQDAYAKGVLVTQVFRPLAFRREYISRRYHQIIELEPTSKSARGGGESSLADQFMEILA